MADPTLVLILRYGHVLFAMAFFGGGLTFGAAIAPMLPRMAPAARRDLIINLFPRYANMMMAFSALMGIFGVLLVAVLTNGDPSLLSPSSPWGLRITVGASLGVIVVLDNFVIIAPSAKGMAVLAREMPADATGPPPARFLTLQRQVAVGSIVTSVLMLTAVGFMVSAALV